VKRIGRSAVAVAAVLAAVWPALAQDSGDDIKRQIDALKQGQQEILKQLDEIKKLIQQPRPIQMGPNVKDVVLDLGSNPVRGSASAKVILVEFTDYQCPFCSRYARETYPQIAKDYVDTGKIRYATLDFPLAMHAKAFDGAKAVLCAGEQGKFWEMHDRLFANQQALEPWNAHAEALGMKVPDFEACMKSDRNDAAIKADQQQGQKAGFTGTPSFVLALTDPKDPKKVKGLVPLVGAQPYDRFKTEIDKALADNK
jgi:protein-disulfide isomerase